MKSSRHIFQRRRSRAFTLLELLLSMSLAGALLIASISFLLSMSEIWGRGSEKRLFDQHVRGVTRFLEAFLLQAKMPEGAAQVNESAANQTPGTGTPQTPPGGGAGAPLTGRPNAGATPVAGAGPGAGRNSASSAEAQTKDRFTFGKPKGYESVPPMLMFEVDQAPGLCIWPERPLPRVECGLQITADEGLVLLWISKLEEDYGQARPRKTQISGFVKEVQFEYFDETSSEWKRESGPIMDPGDVVRMPQRFRLKFVYGSYTREVSISVPPAPGGPPLR